jgi:Arc/MetJ family transcription regulator
MVLLLIVGIIFLVVLVGLLLAFLFSRADRAVSHTHAEMALEEKSFNPGLTLGHRIKYQAEYDDQLIQARREAAKKAAETPRGANSRIGRAGESTLMTASKNTANDPLTAVRIARFHGWDGARTGIQVAAPAAVAGAVAAAPTKVATAPAANAAIAPPNLIAITPEMSPEEVRKARIANSKAEAAYNKALKGAASGAPVVVSGATVPVAGAPVVAAAPVAVGLEPPKLIEITPDMSPEDVRKARVANAKAQSTYNKALKAAGVTGEAVEGVVSMPVAEAVAPQATAQPAAVAGVAPPALIEITDSMSPEEVRRARVANAKAQSAYNKALKAAGIDPASLSGSESVVMAQAEAVASAPIAQPAAVPTGIEPPQLIDITDAMSPEEVRQARVANAKAQSAYNKALKAAGIDPATLN